MNPFKCRHCSMPAHFYFREGGMLCVDHGALHATAQMKDMLERSRLDKSVSDGGVTRSLPAREIEPSVMLVRTPSESPPTVLSSPVAGALASHPLPVKAGAALSDDLPIFPGRKYATTFRVTADNSIQESM